MLIIYLLNRFLYRFKEFVRHWYINSFFIWSNFVISFLERLDRFFAFKITLRFLFRPLYSDYSIIGYILGFIFRFIRLLISGIVYGVIIAIGFFLYLIWLAAPFYIILKILNFDLSYFYSTIKSAD